MKRIIYILAFFSALAFGQTATTFAPGQVLHSSALNTAFSTKMDYIIPGAANNCMQSSGTAWQSVPCSGLLAWASPGAIGSTTPNTAAFTYATVGNQGGEPSGIDVSGTHYDSPLKIGGVGGSDIAQLILHRNSTAWQPMIVGALSNSNSNAHADVINSQGLLSIIGTGFAGADYKIFGSIDVVASGTGTISNTSSPGRIDFNVTPDGSVYPVNILSLHQDGVSVFYGAVEVPSVTSTNDSAFNGVTVGRGGGSISTNIILGDGALSSNSSGVGNIAIGKNAGSGLTTGSNTTIIGNVAGTTSLSDTVILAAGTTTKLTIDSANLATLPGNIKSNSSSFVPYILYQTGNPISIIGIATTFTGLSYADNGGKVQLSSAGVHGVTTTPAVGTYVDVTWAAGTGVNGLYKILSVDSTTTLTIDLSYAVGLGTPSVTVAGNPIVAQSYTLPANSLGANGSIKIDMQGSQIGDGANNVKFRVKFDGTVYYLSSHNDATGTVQAGVIIGNANATNAQLGGADGNGGYGFNSSAQYASSVDTTSNVTIRHTVELGIENEVGTVSRIIATVNPS